MEEVIETIQHGIDNVIGEVRKLPKSIERDSLMCARDVLDTNVTISDVVDVVNSIVKFVNFKMRVDFGDEHCVFCCKPIFSEWKGLSPLEYPVKLRCGDCYVHSSCICEGPENEFSIKALPSCKCKVLHGFDTRMYKGVVLFKDGRCLHIQPCNFGELSKYFNVADRECISNGITPSIYSVHMIAGLARGERVWKAMKCTCLYCNSKRPTGLIHFVPFSGVSNVSVEDFITSINDTANAAKCYIYRMVNDKELLHIDINQALDIFVDIRRKGLSKKRK